MAMMALGLSYPTSIYRHAGHRLSVSQAKQAAEQSNLALPLLNTYARLPGHGSDGAKGNQVGLS
jgi:hypothetical protein